MVSFLDVQKEILNERDFIAEIHAETITLTRLGGYKATPYSLDLDLISEPSAKSLKGVWRWWARAAIVGAHNGKINYKRANEYLKKLLGGTEEGISDFRLEISDISFPKDYRDKLKRMIAEIDEFHNRAKNFLNNISRKLPPDVYVRVVLNPSNAKTIIENKRMKLDDRLMNLIKREITEGPLKEYLSGEIKIGRRGEIIAQLCFPYLKDYSRIARMKMLFMKRKGEEDVITKSSIDSPGIENYLRRIKEELAILVSENLRFKISLYGKKEPDKLNFAISSLLLSLILGGFGSITKRGFGSIRFISYKIEDRLEIDNRIKEILEKLMYKEFNSNELKEVLEQLCIITVIYAKKVFEVKEVEGLKIPMVPSLSNIRIEVKECPSMDLARIGNAFIKQEWKTHPKESGGNLHTWILGLPRFQNDTGYAIKEDSNYKSLRRISSIGVRVFKTVNRNFVIVFGMLSSDWPGFSDAMKEKDLLHISKKPDKRGHYEKPVKKIGIGNSLEKVFDKAFEEVLKRVC